jgi:HPt (histidine-containing phosphotransfer) domain-containing protein
VKLSEETQNLIAAQRRKYIDSMPAKKQAIRQCLTQVNSAVRSGKADLCDQLFQQVHRLAGSAGSYGFDSLGQAAGVVDRYLIAHPLEPGDMGDMAELAGMLQKVLDEIDDIISKNR